MGTKGALSCVKRIRSGRGPTGVWRMAYGNVVASTLLRCRDLHHTVAVEAGRFLFSPTRLVPTCQCVTIHAMWVVKAKILTIKVNLCSKLPLKVYATHQFPSFEVNVCSSTQQDSTVLESPKVALMGVFAFSHGYGWKPPWPLWLCTRPPPSLALPLVSFQGGGAHQANNKWICNWRVST